MNFNGMAGMKGMDNNPLLSMFFGGGGGMESMFGGMPLGGSQFKGKGGTSGFHFNSGPGGFGGFPGFSGGKGGPATNLFGGFGI